MVNLGFASWSFEGQFTPLLAEWINGPSVLMGDSL